MHKCKHHTFKTSKVRHSARLANTPKMGAMRKTQKNLCRKLGMLVDELELVERALQEYMATFNGPLPADFIAALMTMFNHDDKEAKEMDTVVAELVGNVIGDLEGARRSQSPEYASPLHRDLYHCFNYVSKTCYIVSVCCYSIVVCQRLCVQFAFAKVPCYYTSSL